MPRHGTTRLTNALNFTPHTLRMDIPGILDRKVVAECAAWKPVSFCDQRYRPPWFTLALQHRDSGVPGALGTAGAAIRAARLSPVQALWSL